MRVFLLAAFVELVVAANVILHHRVFDPLFPDEPWRQWAVIPEAELPAAQSALATTRFSDNLDAFIGIVQDTEQIQNLYYQVALQTDDLKTPLTYDFSSVRLVSAPESPFNAAHPPQCHLAKANAQTLLFHLSKAGQPQSLDFFVSPIPQDGSCPTLKADAILESFKTVNTTILTRHISPSPQ